MRTSEIFGPIEDWANEHNERFSNCMINKYSGIDRRRAAQIRNNPGAATLKEIETLGDAFGFKIIIAKWSPV